MGGEGIWPTQAVTELPFFPRRAATGHKGTYGHALLIGGSRGLSGAISLAAQGALRSGVGLATVAVPDRCLETVAQFCPVYMVLALPDEQGKIGAGTRDVIQSWLGRADVFAVGPGMGQSEQLRRLVAQLWREIPAPVVLDADGLNNLAADTSWSRLPSPAPRVLTPHPGEMQRLSGVVSSDRDGQKRAAIDMALKARATIVLKGHRTWVTDGQRHYENTTGNPAMASGGSGDVLTGVITALIGQGLDVFSAAVLGVYVHGVAGDIAHKEIGGESVLATDLIAALPRALEQYRSQLG
jgi:NAD(P)H-hydrate epimerase